MTFVPQRTVKEHPPVKNELDLGFRTLTPVWTGGPDQDSSMVKETGILGSLRHWYEGLIRGLGGYACLAAGNNANPCRLDPEKYSKGRLHGLEVLLYQSAVKFVEAISRAFGRLL
jgi:hypothetical protein